MLFVVNLVQRQLGGKAGIAAQCMGDSLDDGMLEMTSVGQQGAERATNAAAGAASGGDADAAVVATLNALHSDA